MASKRSRRAGSAVLRQLRGFFSHSMWRGSIVGDDASGRIRSSVNAHPSPGHRQTKAPSNRAGRTKQNAGTAVSLSMGNVVRVLPASGSEASEEERLSVKSES